jgi:DNA-binding GntR family transcriptional regulator
MVIQTRHVMDTQSTAQRLAYEFLHEKIISGQYPGGMRLRPEHIATELGVSRMPVRESLRQLESEGLVTIHTNRGASVTLLTPEDILEFFEMRAALESLAVRYATPNVSEDVMLDLEHMLARMRRAEAEHLVWIERHDTFHDYLCQHSNRPHLCREITRLRVSVRPYLRLYTSHFPKPELPGYEHDIILDAVRKQDARAAESLTREHVMANANNIANCIRIARDGKSRDPHFGLMTAPATRE